MTGQKGAAEVTKRKLIEVALPLEAINKEAAREKSIRHGHPSTLHLWWARRPLAAARAVLFAQLVDDPASRPEAEAIADPDERDEWVRAERNRLFRMIEELVKWENINDEHLFKEAHEEILRSSDGNPPPIVDPFAGGGAIPLEAQRLGLEAHASDLNPVAVLINKALIEIPPKFASQPPVFPRAAEQRLGDWPKATGLAEDVRRYGQWMRDEAEKRIGDLYPKARLEDGTEATVIAWIWARTLACPNPGCGIQMPLVRSWWLGKKKGKEAYVVPVVVGDPGDKRIEYRIGHDPRYAPGKDADGSVGRAGASCVACGTPVPLEHVRETSRDHGLGAALMAVVAEGKRQRVYLEPTEEHRKAANVPQPNRVPEGKLFDWPGRINVVRYGLTTFASLFTNRQLTALTALSDLVTEARDKAFKDARAAGIPEGERLADGGLAAAAYADTIATYLGFATSRLTNKNSVICAWDSSTKMEAVRSVFSRQAIPMNWDYAEANPWGGSSGDFVEDLNWVSRVIDRINTQPASFARQDNAADALVPGALLSTDPPYYDNVCYSDLSDFFYVWLRRSLKTVHHNFDTLLVPKSDELVANPYRNNGLDGAKKYFEDGFREVFERARAHASIEYPIAVYYAFKQTESTLDGVSSTGWETLLEGMVRSGWSITGTWPMRSELGNRMLSRGTNALASSIVLALRPRADDAPAIERRAFLNRLRDELPNKLRELQQGSIAPVDLAQAAIGPGMALFSRYSEVLEPDGSRMSVGMALTLINQVLAEVLGEQEGDFDADTRWCLKWFEQHAFEHAIYGDAESLAVAMNSTVSRLDRSGAVRSRAGKVALVHPDDLPVDYDPRRDNEVTLWEVTLYMAKALDSQGIAAAGAIMAHAGDRIDVDAAKELAYLAFSIANDKGWSQIAQLYNVLGTTWPEVVAAARSHREDRSEQGRLDLDALY